MRSASLTLPLAWRVALRYLKARKATRGLNAVNVISLISLAGVAVATAAMVCVLSVFNGFEKFTLGHTALIDPQLKVLPARGKAMADGDSLARAIAALPGVTAALPVVEELCLADFRGVQRPVTFKGVPDGYSSVVDVAPLVIDGDPATIGAGAALSVGAAINLEARPNDFIPLRIYTPRRRGRINAAAPLGAFRADSLMIGAVYQVNDQDADADRMIVPLEVARALLDYTTEASAVEVTAPGMEAAELQQALGDQWRVLDRTMQQEDAFRMINVEKWVTFAMLAFILLIASFNIISTLAMLVTEKEGDIGTLRTLGASRRLITGIFASEGALVTLAGGVAGIVAGVALSLTQELTGVIKLGGDHSLMLIEAYPVRVEWLDSLAVLALVGIVAAVTSLAAARMAAPD